MGKPACPEIHTAQQAHQASECFLLLIRIRKPLTKGDVCEMSELRGTFFSAGKADPTYLLGCTLAPFLPCSSYLEGAESLEITDLSEKKGIRDILKSGFPRPFLSLT